VAEIAAHSTGGVELLVVTTNMFADVALGAERNALILCDIEGGPVNSLEALEGILARESGKLGLLRKTLPAIRAMLEIYTIYMDRSLHSLE
jgi:hypothetical protein